MSIGHFLGGIAALIYNPTTEKYLLLRRSSQRDFQAGAWECVTGRVDQGESYEQALHREVREEIGVDVKIDFIIGTTHFYRGEQTPVNELLGVLYACTIVGSNPPQFGDEHSEMCWVTRSEADKLLPDGHWLRSLIVRADLLRSGMPDWLKENIQGVGFEF